jgi:hypothetical protein
VAREFAHWRAWTLTDFLRELRDAMRRADPRVVLLTNTFGAVNVDTYHLFGVDLPELAHVVDWLFVENLQSPRAARGGVAGVLVQNAGTFKLAGAAPSARRSHLLRPRHRRGRAPPVCSSNRGGRLRRRWCAGAGAQRALPQRAVTDSGILVRSHRRERGGWPASAPVACAEPLARKSPDLFSQPCRCHGQTAAKFQW